MTAITEQLAQIPVGEIVAIDNYRKLGFGHTSVPVFVRITNRTKSGMIDVDLPNGATVRYNANGTSRGGNHGNLVPITAEIRDRRDHGKAYSNARGAISKAENAQRGIAFDRLTTEQLTSIQKAAEALAEALDAVK